MMSELVASHRQEILERIERMVAKRFEARPPGIDQIPAFLDGVLLALAKDSERAAAASNAVHTVALVEAQLRQQHGFPIDVVVRSFGSVCDAITGLAAELDVQIDAREMQLLNLCIDDAIADGILHYTRLAEREAAGEVAARVGFVAHEMRNAVNGAMIAFEVLREGRVPIQGRTGDVLDRCLRRLTTLVDRTVSSARLDAGVPLERTELDVAHIIHEVVTGLPARDGATVALELDEEATIDADREVFSSAVGAVVQSAIERTRAGGEVRVRTLRTEVAVLIEVEDMCGGLGVGGAELLFQPAGAGLGLAIARRGVEAHGGNIAVRDRPGRGCVLCLVWPRALPPTATEVRVPSASGDGSYPDRR